MKKYLLSVIFLIAFAFYIVLANQTQMPAAIADTDGGSSTPSSTPTSTPTPTSTGQYKDGTYIGDVADAIYGQLQVTAVISGGKITDIEYPVYPNSPGHTTQVSQSALPALKQEAITAQSAKVDVVSGATQDSEAFQESLASALTQATVHLSM